MCVSRDVNFPVTRISLFLTRCLSTDARPRVVLRTFHNAACLSISEFHGRISADTNVSWACSHPERWLAAIRARFAIRQYVRRLG